jgi:hypothetical protein
MAVDEGCRLLWLGGFPPNLELGAFPPEVSLGSRERSAYCVLESESLGWLKLRRFFENL